MCYLGTDILSEAVSSSDCINEELHIYVKFLSLLYKIIVLSGFFRSSSILHHDKSCEYLTKEKLYVKLYECTA